MELRVLVTGSSGFLLRNSLPHHGWDIVKYEKGKDYYNIDMIIHFGSPTDVYDFEDKEGMATGMIDLTVDLVQIAIKNNAKFVFASSMAVDFLDDDYGVYKKAMEQYIQALVPQHLIMRIPRVYGKDKHKGLMKRIRNDDIGPDDWDKEIQYITIEDFRGWFHEILSIYGVKYYEGKYKKNTIQEIKEIFCAS